MGWQRGRIIGTVAALVLSGLTSASTTLAATPAVADTAPAVQVAAHIVAPAEPVTGGPLTIGVDVSPADPADDTPVPGGSVQLSTDGVPLGTATVKRNPDDPSAVSASVTLTGLGVAGRPGQALSAGLHQIDAIYTPTTGAAPTHGGVAVRVSFFDYRSSTGGFFQDILWLAGQDITGGYADGGFHPTSAVSRQAMAAFLYRAANPGGEPPACKKAPFTDVPASATFCAQIAWLADTGITSGYADGGFHPTAAVSRQAMAAFLQRYQTARQPGSGTIPGCASAPFNDVPKTSQFCAAIAWLVARKVTTGYSDGGFHPTAAVSRQAMAAFLHRLFGAAIGTAKSKTAQVRATADAPVQVTGDPAGTRTITLPKGNPVPTGYQYLVVQPGPGAPDGVLGHITGVTANPDGTTIVTITPATVEEAFDSYSVVGATDIQDPDVTISGQPGRLRSQGPALHTLAAPGKGIFELSKAMFDCSVSGSTDFSVTLDLSDLRVDTSFHVSWRGKYKLAFLASYTPKVTAHAGLAGSGECTLSDHAAITIRIPLGGGLIADISPLITITASGEISATLTMWVAASAGFTVTNDGVKTAFGITPHAQFDAVAAASITLYAGATIGLKLFGIAGVEGDLGPELTGRWSPPACIVFDAGLRFNLRLALDLWVTSWTRTLATGTFANHPKFLQWCLPDAGNVWAWGRGGSGQIGNGVYADSWSPKQLDGFSGVTAIAGGGYNGYALRSDGTVWAWGWGGEGELGNGTTASSNAPVQVTGLSDITAVAGGHRGGYALRDDGTVWAWGDNRTGQLGNETTTNSSVPVRVSGLTSVTAIAAGEWNGYALRSDGTVWAWGYGFRGALGNDSEEDSYVPVQVTGLTNVTAIAAGALLSGYALRSDGTVWAWGYGQYGALGNGTTSDSRVPVRVTGLTEVTGLAAGGYVGYALHTDGTVSAWGRGGYGQLGNGTLTDSTIPVRVTDLTDVIGLAAGESSGYALRADGAVWAWGDNEYGQLGNHSYIGSRVPVQVEALINVTAIAAGYSTAYALR